MKFTVEQTARGIARTIERGDYTLAVARLHDHIKSRREMIAAIVRHLLTKEQLTIMRRYDPDLFG